MCPILSHINPEPVPLFISEISLVQKFSRIFVVVIKQTPGAAFSNNCIVDNSEEVNIVTLSSGEVVGAPLVDASFSIQAAPPRKASITKEIPAIICQMEDEMRAIFFFFIKFFFLFSLLQEIKYYLG